MKYFSTRGCDNYLGFEDAVFQGLAPDGGLYIPEFIPEFEESQLQSMVNLSFVDLAFRIYRRFISSKEIPDQDLLYLCKKSFETFSDPNVTPLKKLPIVRKSNANLENLWVLELFHGPTFAFKDVALQFLGNLFDYFLKRKNSKSTTRKHFVTVVGATSGDTGGAAIYGLRGKENIQLFILHPYKRISPVQELQMTTILDSNGMGDII
jgi:threonine synthase